MLKLHHNCDKEGYTFLAWSLSLVVSLIIALVIQQRTENKRFQENQRRSVIEQVSTIRAQLEGKLNAELLLTQSIITEVVLHADITQERFFAIAQHLMEESRHIKTIGLAKGTVLTYVYPAEGNKAVVGMDYRKNILQWGAIKRSITEKKTVLAGPLDLVQGGRGLISRTPIFLRNLRNTDSADKKYFGMLSVVIKVSSLFKAAGIIQAESSLALSLRGKDGLGGQGNVFYGNKDIFTQEPVLLEVTLPGELGR